MDQACRNAGDASGITGPPHDTRGSAPHKNDPPSLEKKGQPGKEEKENNSLCLLFRAYSPINRGVIPWNEEDPEKLFPLKASSKAPYPVNGASFHIYALKQHAFLHILLICPGGLAAPSYRLISGEISSY
jgi:hypothetical protein